MLVQCTCPGCHQVYTVRRVVLGKRTKCTKCGEAFVLSEAEEDKKSPPLATPVDATPESSAHAAPMAHAYAATTMEPAPIAMPNVASTPPPQPPPPPPPPYEPLEDYTEEEDYSVPPGPRAGNGLGGAPRPRFHVLRLVAKGYELAAVLSAVIAVVVVIVLAVQLIRQPSLAAVASTLLASGLTFFWTVMMAISFYFVAQMIRLALQIEENTHATQKASQDTAAAVRELARQIELNSARRDSLAVAPKANRE